MVALVPPVPAPTTIQRGTGCRSRAIWVNMLGNVVVAPPVGGPLGIGELVHVMPARLRRHGAGCGIHLTRTLHQMAAPTVKLESAQSSRARCCAASPPQTAGPAAAQSRPRSLPWSRSTPPPPSSPSCSQPLHSAYKQRPRQPVFQAARGCVDSSLRYRSMPCAAKAGRRSGIRWVSALRW